MAISYDQARADHEYLWAIGAAYDMTGGYVDQDDLSKLLRQPTKATARDCYCSQIKYWFEIGPDWPATRSPEHWIDVDPTVREIAERHGALPASGNGG